MSNTVFIAIVVVVAVIALFLLFQQRLARVAVDVVRGRIDATMNREEQLPRAGARQRGIEAAGKVTARDETGVGASQENVKSGGDVSAIVTVPINGGAPKKS